MAWAPEQTGLSALRRLLAAIFVVGALGLSTELLLIGHVEDLWQRVPLALIGASLATLAWDAFRRNVSSGRLFFVMSLLLVVGGLVGVLLHYQSNVEFEIEMYPSLAGWQLVREALTGAIPALAPGSLVQLGLIGLAYGYGGAHRRAPVHYEEDTI